MCSGASPWGHGPSSSSSPLGARVRNKVLFLNKAPSPHEGRGGAVRIISLYRLQSPSSPLVLSSLEVPKERMKSKLREGGDVLCTAGAWGVAGNGSMRLGSWPIHVPAQVVLYKQVLCS